MMKPAPLLHGAGGENGKADAAVLARSRKTLQRTPPRCVEPVYAAFTNAIEVVLAETGTTMHQADDLAGLNDGHTAKLLHPDTPSGRVGTWQSVGLLSSAIERLGYRLEVYFTKADEPGTSACGKARSPRTIADDILSRRNLRVRVAESFGRVGGKARAKALSADRRAEIARAAALARWQRRRGS
jgi:hypothetical protein